MLCRLLLVPRFHRTRLDNVLWGRAAGSDLFMAEATLQAKVDRLTPLMPRYRTTFHGVLVCFRLGVRVPGDVVLLSPKRHHDLALRGVERNLDPVNCHDPEIEHLFRCSASSQSVADRILNDAVRQSLAELGRKLKRNQLQIAVSGDAVYLSLATRRRWFGGARSTDFIGVSEIRHFVSDISIVFQAASVVRHLHDGLVDGSPSRLTEPMGAAAPHSAITADQGLSAA